jgi:hypothetical protein
MQAYTPKSLSAAGWLLLGLAAFALPVVARAQVPGQPDKKEQEIKALKARLKALEGAGKNEQAVFELVLTGEQEQDAELAKLKKAIPDLKSEIAKKRDELQALEMKLKAVVAAMEAKQGKIKIDQGKGDKADLELQFRKGFITKSQLEKATAEKAAKEALDKVKKQLGYIELKVDGLDKVIQIEDLKDKLKLKGKDGVPIESIIEDLKLEPDVIIKSLDGKKIEKDVIIKSLDNIKKVDSKNIKVFTEDKVKKGDDIEARLEKLMKELQQLQKEVKASKKKQVQ